MIDRDWAGFYGPAYRSLLAAAKGALPWEAAWARAVAAHHANPRDEGHWEFLATGILHLVDDSDQLAPEHATRVAEAAAHFRRRPPTNNWRVMQAAVSRRLAGRRLTARDLAASGVRPDRDGCLPDGAPGDRSTQYHAYILLLMLRFGDASDRRLVAAVAEGFRWLYASDREHGDPSALGRGRFQLFGYTSMVAAAALADRWGIAVDPSWRARVARRVAGPLADGVLADCWSGPHRALLLHGYNTAADYTGFAELWRPALASLGAAPDSASGRWWWHPLAPGGCGLVADSSGVRAAVLARDWLPEPAGTRAELSALARRALRSAHSAAPVPLVERPLEVAGAHLAISGGLLVVRSDPGVLAARRVVRLPEIWVPKRVALRVESSGCVEREAHTWSGHGPVGWTGVALRIVRRGEVTVTCAL